MKSHVLEKGKKPIYEYRHQNCGKVMEFFVQSSQQKVHLICSHCHSHNLRKIFSIPSAVIIRGLSGRQTTCCGREERCDTHPVLTEAPAKETGR